MRQEDIEAICAGTHPDPFSVLGLHDGPDGPTARIFRPDAETLTALAPDDAPAGTLSRLHPAGFFAGPVAAPAPLRLRATAAAHDWTFTDPYSFGPVLGPVDDHLIAEGSHLRLFDRMGAHPMTLNGVKGVHFAVWAPNASRVSVVGDFNAWDGRRHPMRRRSDIGVWEIFIPGLSAGEAYKFELLDSTGRRLPLKADPFARASELRPRTASRVAADLEHDWGDDAHRAYWRSADPRRAPISIYEVHAGSWRRRDDGGFLSWDELAERLIPYVCDLGFTHIEFLPVSEHPFDPSWGYQTTGLYAPTARFGPPEGFARFIDGAHRAGIGVILDWVPAHFPTDEHGLANFDGTALYEHADPRKGFHPDWKTAIYNFGRREVKSYLINNALYWAEQFHIDGLRVDAVASMLYLDYSREDGEWLPNEKGGRENLEAVAFLREMNTALYAANPGILTIAEESTAWPKVSAPVHDAGLGFGFKWNMGFMHDTLAYLARDPIHRKHHHEDITFGLTYAFSENFVLPLSHDEVVHGKGTLIAKMAGTGMDQFATLRACYAMMWGYPGKKLLFMGQEFAQGREWSESRPLDWHQTGRPEHGGVQDLVRDLNALYKSRPALHARDCEPEGFDWLVVDDRANAVFAWTRRAPGAAPIAVVCNFTPVPQTGYRIPLPACGCWREILNTDARAYAGGGMGNLGAVTASEDERGIAATVTLPPLATLWLEHDGSN